MYKLYFCDINLITDNELQEELNNVSLIRRRYILKKKNAEDRKRSIAVDVLAKRALSDFTAVTEKPEILYGEHGKPYFANYNVHFNASHSGNYTVVALSDKPIGIDIEIIRDFSASAANKILNQDEKTYIMQDDIHENRNRRFFEIWTAKEAYLKLLGLGLSGGIKTLQFSLKNNLLYPNKNINIIKNYSVKNAVISIIEDNN